MKKVDSKPAQRRTVSINEIPGSSAASGLRSRHGAQSIKRNSPTPRRHLPPKSKNGLLLEEYSFHDLPQIQDLNLSQIKEIIRQSETLPSLVENLLRMVFKKIQEKNFK